MLKVQVEELQRTKLNEDVNCELVRLLSEEILDIFHNVSEPTFHSETQFSFDSGVASALSKVREVFVNQGILR